MAIGPSRPDQAVVGRGRARDKVKAKERRVVKPEWGMKHTCQHCGAIFYDMRKTPPTCPKCGAEQEQEKPRARRGAAAAAAAAAAAEAAKPADIADPEVETEDDVLVDDDSEDEEDEFLEDTSDIGDEEDIGGIVDIDEAGGEKE